MILFSRLLVSRFLLSALSSPQTENTRSTYASAARDDSWTWASVAKRGYLLAFVTRYLSPLFSETRKVNNRRRGRYVEYIIIEIYIYIYIIQGGPKKTGLFLTVNNFFCA